jgi:hypothetical protein
VADDKENELDELTVCRNTWKKLRELTPSMRRFVILYLNQKNEATELEALHASQRTIRETLSQRMEQSEAKLGDLEKSSPSPSPSSPPPSASPFAD